MNLKVFAMNTVLPIIQKVSEHFMASYPDISIVLSGGGSGTGIKSQLAGITNVAMSSRGAKSGEDMDLTRTTITVDTLVPIVHPETPVKNLSIEQLRNIFSGKSPPERM